MKIFTFKSLFVALMMLCGVAANAQEKTSGETRLYIEPFSILAGEEKSIEVLLDNPCDSFCGLQFDIYFPEGIEVVCDEVGPLIELGSRTSSRYHETPQGSFFDAGFMRVVCFSQRSYTFKGESGDVIIIPIKASNDMKLDVYELAIKNIELVRPDATNVKPAETTTMFKVCDETGIEEVMGEAATGKGIHDILGRKVNKITTPGIYVINGKKTFVK